MKNQNTNNYKIICFINPPTVRSRGKSADSNGETGFVLAGQTKNV